MASTVFFEWDAQEYAFEEKSADWYWALGVIAVAGSIASIIFGNFILALLIVAAAGSLALTAARAPRTHHFVITDEGLVVDQVLHPYDEMLHFSVLEYVDSSMPPSLSIKTKRLLAPHLLIPLQGPDPFEIYTFFSAHLEEGRHEQSFIDMLVRLFRL